MSALSEARVERPVEEISADTTAGGAQAFGGAADLQKAVFDRAARAAERGDFSEALIIAAEGLVIDRLRPEAWCAYGQILRQSGRPRDAAHCFSRAIELSPNDAGFWSELGGAFNMSKAFTRSLACHERAIGLAPNNTELLHNYGAALMQAGREEAAAEMFDRVLALRPASPRAQWERGVCRLRLGDYAGGWPGYEARLKPGMRAAQPPAPLSLPKWAGESLDGRTLLVAAEQGLGDMIWCARYLRSLRRMGARVILQCGVELVELFKANAVADQLVVLGQELPAADFYIDMCSLPPFFVRSAADIDGAAYLSAPEERRSKFAPWLTPPGAPLRIGINWSGNPRFPGNRDRSADVGQFIHAFDQPGVQLYSLQKGPAASELSALSMARLARPRVVDLGALFDDLADAAAACMELDLVVTTCTSMAHLCGALGVPVWLLLNFRGYWLWGLTGQHTPWYRSMSLIRAERWNDWGGVFDCAGARLQELLSYRVV